MPVCEADQSREAPADEVVRGYITFAFYLKRKTGKRALALAVLPACIFLLSGLLLHHWLLAAFALLFGAAHIYVVKKNVSVSDI